MRKKDEIKSEINRITENKYKDIPNVTHETEFSCNAYLKGLKYALGNNINKSNIPSKKVVNTIVERFKKIPDVENITVKRRGKPPQYIELDIIVEVEIETVDQHSQLNNLLTQIAIEECSEDKMVYTRINRIN